MVQKKKRQVRVTGSFVFTSRVTGFTHSERVTELICKRLLFYVLRKYKDLTRILVAAYGNEKNLSLVDEILIYH